MPLTNAVRIWAMKREAERNLAAKLAEQEKSGRKGHGTDRRLEHVPEAQEGVAGDHVIAAVTAAFAPPKNPKAEAVVSEYSVAPEPAEWSRRRQGTIGG